MADIENNKIYMQRKDSTETKDTVEAILFGAERVNVGVKTGNKVTVRDEDGYFKEVDEVVGKTVYDLQKQKRKAFFMLDLETGNRGWYPGKDYYITCILTNIIADSLNPEKVDYNSTATLTFAADEGYNLPDSIVVSEVETYTWDKSTGTLVITHPQGPVKVAISGVAK